MPQPEPKPGEPPYESFGDALKRLFEGDDPDTCKECGKPLEDDEKKRGK